jgi:hypothetical protein
VLTKDYRDEHCQTERRYGQPEHKVLVKNEENEYLFFQKYRSMDIEAIGHRSSNQSYLAIRRYS